MNDATKAESFLISQFLLNLSEHRIFLKLHADVTHSLYCKHNSSCLILQSYFSYSWLDSSFVKYLKNNVAVETDTGDWLIIGLLISASRNSLKNHQCSWLKTCCVKVLSQYKSHKSYFSYFLSPDCNSDAKMCLTLAQDQCRANLRQNWKTFFMFIDLFVQFWQENYRCNETSLIPSHKITSFVHNKQNDVTSCLVSYKMYLPQKVT